MKLTIGQRILLGIGIVEALALVLGAYLLYTLSHLRDINNTIRERDLKALETLDEATRKQQEAKAQREMAVVQYLLKKAPLPAGAPEVREGPDRARERWRNSHQQLRALLKALGELAAADAQSATSGQRQRQWEAVARSVEEAEEARSAAQESAEHVFDLLAQGKFDSVAGPLRATAERRKNFDQKLAKGIDQIRRQVEIGTEEAESTYRSARRSALGGLGLMLVLGLVAGLAVRRSVTRPLGQFMQFAERVGQGDLTCRAPSTSVPDLEQLGQTLDQMVAGLKELTGQIAEATHNLQSAAQEILASVQQTATGTREQAASVQEITATVEEIGQSGGQIAERAKRVAAGAEAAAATTAVGLQAVQAATGFMRSIREQVEAFAEHIVALSEKTQAVGEINAAVTDVAERSNLLALNAAIEAAGAGEHGPRFGVVAGEMKNLADQAKEATVQVQTILGGIQKGINSSVMLTEEAVKRAEAGKEQAEKSEGVIRQMAETTQECVQAFQQIIAATNQQQIGLEQVTQGMRDIRQAATQTAQATAQLEGAVANVSALSQQLEKAVRRYRM